jgi:sensor histidine kinase YesM
MESLGKNGPVPFAEELDHTEKNLKLEKLRFGSVVNWNLDIQKDDFGIPPLSIQPIVENAVRHGILKKREGGTVTITTRASGNNRIIIVADDGVGYKPGGHPHLRLPPMHMPNNRSGHIGLENVRHRLEMRMGGTLEVQSKPGAGTVVTITMPVISPSQWMGGGGAK